MNLRLIKKFFAISLLLSLYINSYAISAELRNTECVPFSDSPDTDEDSARTEAQELSFQAFQVRQNACRNEDGSFKRETVQFPPGARTDETEQLDCVSMAEQAYMMSVRNNCQIDRSGLISCLTNGWDQRDVFDLFDSIQEVDQALPTGEDPDPFANKLGMKLEEHFACPGKSEPEGAIYKAISCNIVSSVAAMVPFGNVIADKVVNSMVPASSRPAAGECIDTENSCLTQVLWGAIQNVFTNIQGLYDLGKMAVQGVVNGAKYVGRKISDGWNRLWGNDQVEDASADQLAAAARLQNEIRTNEEAQKATGNWAQRLVSGLMSSIGEGMRDQFSCSKWESGVSQGALMSGLGAGLVNRIGSGTGLSSARCVEASPSWECASAKQKVQMVCGIAGFVGGEIVTTLLTGGAVRALSAGGKAIASAAGNGSRVAKAALAVGRGTAGLARGVLNKTGKGISVVATRATNGAKSLGGMGLKVADKVLPMNQSIQLMYMRSYLQKSGPVISGAKKAAGAVAWPVKKYFNTLDRAYMLGRYGQDGSFALRNLSKATKADEITEALEKGMMSKNLHRKKMLPDEDSFRAMSEGKDALENLTAAQTTLKDTQEAFLEAVKKARQGANGPNGQALIDEADAAFLAYKNAKNSLAPLDEAYTQALVQHQARIAEEARLAEQARLAEEARLAAINNGTGTTALTVQSNRGSSVTRTTSNPPARTSSGSSSGAGTVSGTRTVRIGETTGGATRRGIGSAAQPSPNDIKIGNFDYDIGQRKSLINGFMDNLHFDNKSVRIFRNNSDNWTEKLVNPRIEGDELVGNLHKANGIEKRIRLEEIDMLDFRGTFNSGAPGAVDEVFSMPLSVSHSQSPSYGQFTDLAADGIKRSNDEVNTLLRQMNDMTRAQASRVGGIAHFKLSTGQVPTEVEFLAAIKNSSGYITKQNLPHIDKLRQVYNSKSTEEAFAIINDIYKGTNSEVTNLIKSNIILMTKRLGKIRAPRQLVTTVQLTNDANIVRQNAIGSRTDDLLLEGPPTPLQITSGSGNTALVPSGNRLPQVIDDVVPPPALRLSTTDYPVPFLSRGTLRTGMSTGGRNAVILSGAALTAAAITNANTQDNALPIQNLDEIVISTNRRYANLEYILYSAYQANPVRKCFAYVKKRKSDGDLEDTALEEAGLQAEGITIKWFKVNSENPDEEVCKANNQECLMPEGKKHLYIYAYKGGEKISNVACASPDDVNTREREDPFNPYDTDDADSDGEGSDLDMASQFYEQQRSPPPSLFQAAPIPRRPTHYLHSGWY